LDKRHLLEQHTIEYIPLAERRGKVWHLWPIWFAGDAHLATLAVGCVAFFKSRQAQDAEYQKLVAQANADRANAAAQLERELADVARRVNDLRRDEYALAEEVDGVFGPILPRVMRSQSERSRSRRLLSRSTCVSPRSNGVCLNGNWLPA
jgi:hypothetical protein